MKEHYLPILLKHAGSTTFIEANAIASFIKDKDLELAQLLTEEECFLLIIEVLKAARHSAIKSENLRDAKFKSIPKLKGKFILFAEKYTDNAAAIVKDKYSSDILLSSLLKQYFIDDLQE